MQHVIDLLKKKISNNKSAASWDETNLKEAYRFRDENDKLIEGLVKTIAANHMAEKEIEEHLKSLIETYGDKNAQQEQL